MKKTIRKKLFIDESRLYSYTTQTVDDGSNIRAATFGYFWHDDITESYSSINATNQSKDFTGITLSQKSMYMRYFDLTSRGYQTFYTSLPATWTVLQPPWNKQTRFYESKVEYIFVPKFSHDRASAVFFTTS